MDQRTYGGANRRRLTAVGAVSASTRSLHLTALGCTDISGWWLDGDILHIGAVRIGAGARVAHRGMLMPGAVLGRGAELAPGGRLDGEIPDGESWTGSPARPCARNARDAWPAPPLAALPPLDRRLRTHPPGPAAALPTHVSRVVAYASMASRW
ncbi:hypothetical protein [Streptomyces natalensis]|uniref:Uncharacterized protein n=1 Tax=Streptomyces natalensis ATCC 27448 TaxID=1240678 RepID=A0A0D7CK86_9ACTN|nr:hypothetical protein [Streptomyces natalensis]KIZ15837.1 hypothetical protein SNA_21320 [Streptomyces natalensis ATCC 27448]